MIKIKINSKLKEAKREAPGLDYGVFLHGSSRSFSLYLVDLDSLREQIGNYRQKFNIDKRIDPGSFFEYVKSVETAEYEKPGIIGFIQVKDQNSSNTPCLKALDVEYTAIHEARGGQGIGKLMYLLAMAKASQSGRPLMPDRLNVEPAAAGIWSSFSNDGSVIKSFDKSGNPVAGKDSEHSEDIASYFDVEEPKKTKNKLDDCSPANEEPYGVPLNRAYYSSAMDPQLQSYINNFNAFINNNFTSNRGVEDGLYEISHGIFRRRF